MSEADAERAGREDVWIEKYRPQRLADIAGHEDIIERLQSYVDRDDLSHTLFSGPAGVGKTTAAMAIAKELYGEEWEENFLELNASDERGIDVVRDRVKSFARTSFGGYSYRLIFLDEADALTSDAQAALRRTMEQFSDNVRFILSCNYSSQIIDPIQSRCAVFRFSPLSDAAIESQVRRIAEAETIEVTDDGVEALVYVAGGDMRKAINGLQAASVTVHHTPLIVLLQGLYYTPSDLGLDMTGIADTERFFEISSRQTRHWSGRASNTGATIDHHRRGRVSRECV